jgi:hypothetical protein
VALLVASVSLVALFERHVERRIGAELTSGLNQPAAATTMAPAGDVTVEPPPADPRFEAPLSGLYRQLAAGSGLGLAIHRATPPAASPPGAVCPPASGPSASPVSARRWCRMQATDCGRHSASTSSRSRRCSSHIAA